MTAEQNPSSRDRRALVSVVVPCFNAAPFVTETIDSALRQSYPRVEVVAVDDGSTDDTREKLRAYGRAIRLFEQPNQGRSMARNRGLAEARGDFVVFLDSDDLLEPHHVETLMRVMDGQAGDVVYGRAEHFVDVDGRPRVAFRRPCHEGDQARRILEDNFIPPPAAAMVRRQLLVETGVRFQPGRRCGEDWEFWIRLVLAGARVRFADRVVALCREHASNTRRDLAGMDEAVLGWFGRLGQDYDEIIQRRGLGELYARGRSRLEFRLAAVRVFLGERREGRRSLLRLARRVSLLRAVDRARLPAVILHSLVPVPLPTAIIRVVYGQHCALNRRLQLPAAPAIAVSAGERAS